MPISIRGSMPISVRDQCLKRRREMVKPINRFRAQRPIKAGREPGHASRSGKLRKPLNRFGDGEPNPRAALRYSPPLRSARTPRARRARMRGRAAAPAGTICRAVHIPGSSSHTGDERRQARAARSSGRLLPKEVRASVVDDLAVGRGKIASIAMSDVLGRRRRTALLRR